MVSAQKTLFLLVAMFKIFYICYKNAKFSTRREEVILDHAKSKDTVLSSALLSPGQRFINRDFSWLQFNNRVLFQAANIQNPLLERLRFLSISAANLDEFFMLRVAPLLRKVETGRLKKSLDARTPEEQLKLVLNSVDNLRNQQENVFKTLYAELNAKGIALLAPGVLHPEEKEWLEKYFQEKLLPFLHPILADAHNALCFPFMPNLGLFTLFELKVFGQNDPIKAFLLLPLNTKRFILLPERGDGTRFIKIEDVVCLFAHKIFPGCVAKSWANFRIIRNSEIEFEETQETVIDSIKLALDRQKKGPIVCVTFEHTAPLALRKFVINELASAMRPTQEILMAEGSLLALDKLAEISSIDRPELKFIPYTPSLPQKIAQHKDDYFSLIAEEDVLLHHPYESFDCVVTFLKQAAHDPQVIAIKQTLYRTSRDSAVVHALIEAAEKGKDVTVLVELKARFDEEANIAWAQALESAGVQVVFSFISRKVHAKMGIIVRREGAHFRSYAHIGTGNYHSDTAKIYTDLSLFTANKEIVHDIHVLFDYLTDKKQPPSDMQVAFSPVNLKNRIVAHIKQEIENARAGRPAAIWMKVNALGDREIIDLLYAASRAGVKIDLVVRGICSLAPERAHLSENIRVKSIVWRFLEHSRIFCFANGADLPHREARVYIGSADMMPRNLEKRMEILVPILSTKVRMRILYEIMHANLMDNTESFAILADGSFKPIESSKGSQPYNAQSYFMSCAGFYTAESPLGLTSKRA